MNDQKEETVEEYEARFSADWKNESTKLLAFMQTDPFKKIAQEIENSMDAILSRRFNDPRNRTIKSLMLVHLLGKVLKDWVVPHDAPLAGVYRKLLKVTAQESALGHLTLTRAMQEGVEYTNRMVSAVIQRRQKGAESDIVKET